MVLTSVKEGVNLVSSRSQGSLSYFSEAAPVDGAQRLQPLARSWNHHRGVRLPRPRNQIFQKSGRRKGRSTASIRFRSWLVPTTPREFRPGARIPDRHPRQPGPKAANLPCFPRSMSFLFSHGCRPSPRRFPKGSCAEPEKSLVRPMRELLPPARTYAVTGSTVVIIHGLSLLLAWGLTASASSGLKS